MGYLRDRGSEMGYVRKGSRLTVEILRHNIVSSQQERLIPPLSGCRCSDWCLFRSLVEVYRASRLVDARLMYLSTRHGFESEQW